MHISDQRFSELLQQGANKMIAAQAELQAAVDDATMHFLAPNEPQSVAKVLQQSNLLSIIHMLSQIVRSPGIVPEPVLSDDLIKLLETRVRHGTADLTIKGFRVGQSAAWRIWMKTAFQLSDDPEEVLGLLDRSSVLLNAFIEQTIELANSHIERFRAELASGTPKSHRDLIMALLEGQVIDPISASRRLAYPLTGQHQALVVWSDDIASDQRVFDAFALDLAKQPRIGATVSMVDKAASFWVWFSGDCPVDLTAILKQHGLRGAQSNPLEGIDGFGLSHRQALIAQDVSKPTGGALVLLAYEDAVLPSILLNDKAAFARFASEALGELINADPAYQISLRAYLQHGCNLAQTAAFLGVHRNTLQKRIERASDLLPVQLGVRNRVEVGAALIGLAYA